MWILVLYGANRKHSMQTYMGILFIIAQTWISQEYDTRQKQLHSTLQAQAMNQMVNFDRKRILYGLRHNSNDTKLQPLGA